MKWNNEWMRRGLLLALVCAAAGMLLGNREKPKTVAQPTPAPTAAPNRRLSREEAYEKDLEALRQLAQAGDEYAAEQMRQLIGMHQSEWAIEEALLNAGFERCLVVAQKGSITVMVDDEKMTEENSARILALCMAHAEVDAQNVRIMAY